MFRYPYSSTSWRSRLAELRIKIISLGLEQKVIRTEERRLTARAGRSLDPDRSRALTSHALCLREHRKDLGQKVRAALLAYAFLRGKPACVCERKIPEHIAEKARDNAMRFGAASSNGFESADLKKHRATISADFTAWLATPPASPA
jgi:hypothetical protein